MKEASIANSWRSVTSAQERLTRNKESFGALLNKELPRALGSVDQSPLAPYRVAGVTIHNYSRNVLILTATRVEAQFGGRELPHRSIDPVTPGAFARDNLLELADRLGRILGVGHEQRITIMLDAKYLNLAAR